MAAVTDHVFPEIIDLLDADVASRLRTVHEERWVTYPGAKSALSRIERLYTYPRRSRMPCLLLVGRSGMGKTMIIEKFCRTHRGGWQVEASREHIPVLSTIMRPQPTMRRFYAQLLYSLGAPVLNSSSTIALEDRAYRLMKAVGVSMLIVDEIHNVFSTAKASDRDAMMVLLRTMVSELKIPLICAGTDEAENAILGDDQLASRYEALRLPAWGATAEFQGLVGSALRAMPLRLPSDVSVLAIRHLVDITAGVTARLFRVLADLAEEAIVSGVERVNSRMILDLPTAPRAAAG